MSNAFPGGSATERQFRVVEGKDDPENVLGRATSVVVWAPLTAPAPGP